MYKLEITKADRSASQRTYLYFLPIKILDGGVVLLDECAADELHR